MEAKVILVHGFRGRPDNHWFPWLRLELLARNFRVSAPKLPHAAAPKLPEWLSFLNEYADRPDKGTFFVGHSLGCITIVRYLAALPPKALVGGCVFVAGFSGRVTVPEFREFYETPLQLKEARRHCEHFTMIFSNNDPFVPMERSLSFARDLDARTILERGRGHFTTEDGVVALPSALNALLKMSS